MTFAEGVEGCFDGGDFLGIGFDDEDIGAIDVQPLASGLFIHVEGQPADEVLVGQTGDAKCLFALVGFELEVVARADADALGQDCPHDDLAREQTLAGFRRLAGLEIEREPFADGKILDHEDHGLFADTGADQADAGDFVDAVDLFDVVAGPSRGLRWPPPVAMSGIMARTKNRPRRCGRTSFARRRCC